MIPNISLEIKRTKVCTSCKIEKSIENFGRKMKFKDGINNECKECGKKKFKDYYLLNKDKVKEKNKNYYFNNIEYYREYNKDYQKMYVKTERGNLKKKLQDHTRRLKLVGKVSDGTVTDEALINLIASQNCKCVYCKKDISNYIDRHLDHIQPLARNGLHTMGNLQWLCVKCNLRKNSLLEEDFIKNLGRYGIEYKV